MKHVRMLAQIDGFKLKKDKVDELVLPNGSNLMSLPCSSSTIRGFPADDVYGDEIAHWKRDAEVMQAIGPSLTRSDRQRNLTLTTTPFGQRGDLWRIWNDEKSEFRKYKVDANQAIAGGCPIDLAICRTLVPNDVAFRQEYLCDFVDESVSYFPFELISPCWDETVEYLSDAQLLALRGGDGLYAGYDPAKIVDSGVLTLVERIGGRVVSRYCRAWRGTNYSEQLAHIAFVCRNSPVVKLTIDSTGVGVKILEDLQKELGQMVEGVTFTNQNKENLISGLRVLFQDKNILIPYDRILINELHSTQRIISESGNVKYEHERIEGRHGDRVWSLALACRGLQVGGVGHYDKTTKDVYEDPSNVSMTAAINVDSW